MKYLKHYTFILLLFSIMIISCSNGINDTRKNDNSLSVRCYVKSDINKGINFSVSLENGEGQIVNGAFIMVSNSEGIASILNFDNSLQAYTGTIDGLVKDLYLINIKSNLLEKDYTVEIPHERLTEKPVILAFSDSDGNDVLKGNTLNKDSKIQLAWSSCGENVNYQIVIKNSSGTKWASSENKNSIIIPESVLSEGVYYLVISAQKSFGDLYFETASYYSVSNISSSTVSFCLE